MSEYISMFEVEGGRLFKRLRTLSDDNFWKEIELLEKQYPEWCNSTSWQTYLTGQDAFRFDRAQRLADRMSVVKAFEEAATRIIAALRP